MSPARTREGSSRDEPDRRARCGPGARANRAGYRVARGGGRALRACAALTVLGLLLVACAPAAPSARSTPVPASTGSPAKTGTGEARHDLGPLAERIPALSDATAATWASGTLGDARVPGPSLYWIDAVVALPPGAAEQLRASLDLEPADARPDVVAALRPVLPDGDLLTGAALDRAFSADGWRATAYLERDGAGLVLLVVGGQ